MSATVRHWRRSGFQCEHQGADTVAALWAAVECRSLRVNEATVRVMAVQLETDGKSTYMSDNGNLIFRMVV